MLYVRDYFTTETIASLSPAASVSMASSAPAWLARTIWDPETAAPHPLHPHHCTPTSRGKLKDGRMLTKCSLASYLFSMISNAAKKALCCPLSSHLICEPPATGLPSMSGIFVETICKTKCNDLLQTCERQLSSRTLLLHSLSLDAASMPSASLGASCNIILL